jgi:hypothetical protein
VTDATICPGCGMIDDHASAIRKEMSCTEGCWDRYLAVAAFETEHLMELGRFHQLMVDTYGAQHPETPTPPIRVTYSLIGLYLSIVLGWSGFDVRNVHSRMGKPQPWWPTFRRSAERSSITAADVVLAGQQEGPSGHARLMDLWALSVWGTWASEHDNIAKFAAALHLLDR